MNTIQQLCDADRRRRDPEVKLLGDTLPLSLLMEAHTRRVLGATYPAVTKLIDPDDLYQWGVSHG